MDQIYMKDLGHENFKQHIQSISHYVYLGTWSHAIMRWYYNGVMRTCMNLGPSVASRCGLCNLITEVLSESLSMS